MSTNVLSLVLGHTHTHTHTSTHYRKGPPNSSKKAENISGGKYSKNISGGKNILFQNLHILIPGDHMEGWETACGTRVTRKCLDL